jgi:hypothetical protein
VSAVLKAADELPAAVAFSHHTAALTALEAELAQPGAALAKVTGRLESHTRARQQLETLRAQRGQARTAQLLGEESAADVSQLDRTIATLGATIAEADDERASLEDAARVLKARLTTIQARIAAEGQRGPMLVHALHRELIVELLPEFVKALEPALDLWAKIVAHGDAADARRKGPDAMLAPTMVGVERTFGIPRLLNLSGLETIERLLGEARQRAEHEARQYVRQFAG